MPSDFENSNQVYSMTGYGEGRAKTGDSTIEVTIRTVNHKDTSVKIRGLQKDQSLAHKAEKFVRNSFPRGRIEVNIATEGGKGLSSVELDVEAIGQSFDSLSRLTEELGLVQGPELKDLIDLDLLETKPPYKGNWSVVQNALADATEETLEAQKDEGEDIKEDLLAYLSEISRRLSRAENWIPEIVNQYQEELKDRIENLVKEGVELDEGKLEQEVAVFADKVDVNEEISRAQTHIETARESLNQGGVIGKKLEFIRQELQREINTLGAKSKDGGVQSEVIEMKLALEKFKEQTRNLA